MMNVNGENKNMENKNKRKPRMYLQPVPDDETREVPLWLRLNSVVISKLLQTFFIYEKNNKKKKFN